MSSNYWKPTWSVKHLFTNKAELIQLTAEYLRCIEHINELEAYVPCSEGLIDLVGWDSDQHCIYLCRMVASYQQIVYKAPRLIEKYRQVFPNSRYHVISAQELLPKWVKTLNRQDIHTIDINEVIGCMRYAGLVKEIHNPIVVDKNFSTRLVRT